ncbi:transposase [Antarcticibacterium sp. 1MA-6-2]|uniref:transposase n=1 Tax=Antarcticibacterium sp. 1MA-6-2 TaxID=2908210 RepID=UPI001F3B7951|nr:transposase [Antarcticibacterium sp. 1MA-6-2]UJH89885.1 transposase [Antarcticibacterium sp. 1MA-6-2]
MRNGIIVIFSNWFKNIFYLVAHVLAYCLLKNHFHLLIKTRDFKNENLISKAFSNLFNAYSKAINKAYGRRGSLFQDRFKRIIVKDEEYLRTLILYIHLNPMNHNFTDDFASYNYSSFRPLLLNNYELLDVEGVIDLFGDTANFKNAHILRQDEILERDEELFLE